MGRRDLLLKPETLSLVPPKGPIYLSFGALYLIESEKEWKYICCSIQAFLWVEFSWRSLISNKDTTSSEIGTSLSSILHLSPRISPVEQSSRRINPPLICPLNSLANCSPHQLCKAKQDALCCTLRIDQTRFCLQKRRPTQLPPLAEMWPGSWPGAGPSLLNNGSALCCVIAHKSTHLSEWANVDRWMDGTTAGHKKIKCVCPTFIDLLSFHKTEDLL